MIVYENEGHARRMSRTYPHFAWKIREWRIDPRCRNPECQKKMHLMPWEGKWQDQATLDHILSRGMGGSDTEDNFQLLCGKCNNKKSRHENVNNSNMMRIDVAQFRALVAKASLLDALRKEGVKDMPIWDRAQLRLKSSIDNSKK